MRIERKNLRGTNIWHTIPLQLSLLGIDSHGFLEKNPYPILGLNIIKSFYYVSPTFGLVNIRKSLMQAFPKPLWVVLNRFNIR